MHGSGIIRRFDDLGRIVIPKEIRRAIGITEGTPMEIFYDNKEGTIVLKKYLAGVDLLQQVKSLDIAVSDMADELGAEATGDIRRYIEELKALLSSQEGSV